jgi:serine/threonine protein kinase
MVDLKPRNVLFDRDDKGLIPMLTDFRNARIIPGRIQSTTTFKNSAFSIAKYNYAAPELIVLGNGGAEPGDLARCDVFSLGMVLYEMITHSSPWSAETSDVFIPKLLDGQRPVISEEANVSRRFDPLLNKLWHQTPTERPLPSAILANF